MNRKEFILKTGAATLFAMTLNELHSLASSLEETPLMPAMFVGHGNPMNAIEENEFSLMWKKIGKEIPTPKAIVCVSAHWQTKGTFVTAAAKPETIHDFGGFPEKLFQQQYPAPGDPMLAEYIIEHFKDHHVQKDQQWGLDHGTWSILLPMFPEAKIPVLQISLDYYMSPEKHYQLGKALAALRKRGVLILGSGNIVHNLGMINWNGGAYDWAIEFDNAVKAKVESGDHAPLINYTSMGKAAQLAVPTNDHYLPMLYILGMQQKGETPTFFNNKAMMGSLSMTSFILGK